MAVAFSTAVAAPIGQSQRASETCDQDREWLGASDQHSDASL